MWVHSQSPLHTLPQTTHTCPKPKARRQQWRQCCVHYCTGTRHARTRQRAKPEQHCCGGTTLNLLLGL